MTLLLSASLFLLAGSHGRYGCENSLVCSTIFYFSKYISYTPEADDRPICEPLCTEESNGCNRTTEYCALTATIGLGVGCCRAKMPVGEYCLPVNNGTDCISGICNNLIEPFQFAGITWTLGFWNLFGGYCGSIAMGNPMTVTTTTTETTTTTTTTTTTELSTGSTQFQACPIATPDPCVNQIPDCLQLEQLQTINPSQVTQLCNDGLTQCCPRVCMFMQC